MSITTLKQSETQSQGQTTLAKRQEIPRRHCNRHLSQGREENHKKLLKGSSSEI